jgi:O-antigen/teichoic acid export membrane protein
MLTQLTALPLVLIMGEVFSPDQETTLIVWGFSLLKLLEGLMNVAIGEHLRFENSGMVANIQLLRGGIYAVTFSTAIFLTSQAAVAVWAVAIALTLPALLAHLSLGKRGRIMRATRREIIGLTQQAWPLGIGFFVGSVTVNGPRFLVEMYHGVESLAVFTAVSYVVVLSNTIVDSVTQGIMPRLARYWGGGKDEHVLTITKKVSLIVATLGFIGIVIAIIVGDRILALLFGLPYASGQTVLIALFSYATLQYVASTVRSTLIAGGVRKSVLWVSLVNLTVTLASSFLLVPLYGPESAGWSLAIGQIVQLAMYLYLVKALGKAREVKFEGGALE